MTAVLRRNVACLLACLLLAVTTAEAGPGKPAATPKSTSSGNLDFTNDFIGITIGVIAIATGIGIGIYYATRKPRISGCIAPAGEGLQMLSGDHAWRLSGQTSALHTGEKVKVFGKKQKTAAGREFVVDRVGKDYGPCPVPAGAMH